MKIADMPLEQTTRAQIASNLAKAIREAIDSRTTGNSGKVPKATLATSFALHIALEAVAIELNVDPKKFKIECGVGQPLAYFI